MPVTVSRLVLCLVVSMLALPAYPQDGSVVDPPATSASGTPIWGMADTHTHMFSNLGFGGLVVWGEPFNTGGIGAAMPSCEPLHGLLGVDDLPGIAAGQGLLHFNGGSPQFDGWPRWNTYTHQQMHVEWLHRAFLGGLKLIVIHAVNNEALCGAMRQIKDRPGVSCNDMAMVDRQLASARHVESHVPWFRIAHSAAEARQIIDSGKLAVVLGIEVDFLFNCAPEYRAAGGVCSADYVKQQLKTYYDRGVRHIHPIHLFDNGFGGAAIFDEMVNYGNAITNGQFFTTRECAPEGYRFKVLAGTGIGGWLAGVFGIPTPPDSGFAADCNARGLTSLGSTLLNKMMSRKMIIDVDHMSVLTMNQALTKFAAFDYPVISGHTGFVDVSIGPKRHEAQKSGSQIDRIRALGGFVSPLTHQGSRSEILQYGTRIPNDCSTSSKTFAQAYLYARDRMQGGAVGIASDWNGFAGQPGPRFGFEQCSGDLFPPAQGGGVAYPFPVFGMTGSLGKSVTGNRAFDFNFDGLAHAGMLPDFVADLRSLGLQPDELAPLFNSAEAYIRMWEKAESRNLFPPSLSLTVAPAANGSGWHNTAVTVTAAGTENSTGDGWPVNEIQYSASGAQPISPTSVPGATASFVIASDGVTVVTGSARDEAGNVSSAAGNTIKLDRTAPSVTCGAADDEWHAADVAIACTGADGISGLANPADAAFPLSTAVPVGSETSDAATASRRIVDLADNVTVAGPISGNRIDRKAPSIVIASPNAPAYLLNQAVAAAYACTDGGSGVVDCNGPVPNGSNITTSAAGAYTFTVNTNDAVGNETASAVGYVVSYGICLLYDATRARPVGSTVPLRLQLCDAAGTNVSSALMTLSAIGVTQISTQAPGVLESAGAANADNNFRFDPGLAGYVFNLKTTGFAAGTYRVTFNVTGDPKEHGIEFQLK